MKVCIIGPYPQKENQPMTGPMRVVYNLVKELEKIDDIEVEVPNRNEKSKIKILWNILKSDADIFNIHGSRIIRGLIFVLLKFLNSKVVSSLNGLIKIERTLGAEFKPVLSVFFETLIIKHSDKISTVSKNMKNWIEKYYKISPQKIEVIPNGVGEKFFERHNPGIFLDRFNISKNKKIISFVGGTREVKGLDFLLDSLNKLGNNKDWLCFIIGPRGDQDSYLKNKVSNSDKLNKNIIFMGKISSSLLLSAYSATDVFILPSKYEPFGMVALEAMASGKPVIVSDKVGMNYIIEDGKNGFIVKYGNQKQLAERIDYLIRNHKESKEMGKLAKKTAKNNNWTKIAMKYIEFFNNIVGDLFE